LAIAQTPIDLYIPMNTGTVGETITPAVMAAGTLPRGSAWTQPYNSGALTIAKHGHSLPASITVAGVAYGPSSSSQAIAYNDAQAQDTAHYLIGGSHTKASIGAWITIGPAGGNANNWELFDWLILWDQSGVNYACLETFIGGPTGTGGNLEFSIETKVNGATTHTGPINITQGATYWVTMKADWTAATAYLNVYDVNLNLVGSVTGQMTAGTYHAAALDIGNQEAGVQSGNSTQFENIVLDLTNAVFPLLVSTSAMPAPPTNLKATVS
jgi:hypothetical protein